MIPECANDNSRTLKEREHRPKGCLVWCLLEESARESQTNQTTRLDHQSAYWLEGTQSDTYDRNKVDQEIATVNQKNKIEK